MIGWNRSTLLLLLLLFSSTLTAGVVDRRLLDTPDIPLQPIASPRIVAGGTHSFLAHQQRVTTAGVLVDATPIIGAHGRAVRWHDGWLLIQAQYGPSSTLSHLGEEGSPEVVMTFAPFGTLLDATSNGDRVAIVEKEDAGGTQRLWVSVLTTTRFVQRRVIDVPSDVAGIAPLGDGFLLVTSTRASETEWVIHAWRLDADGTPQEVQQIHRTANYSHPERIDIATDRQHALIATNGYSASTAFIVDAALNAVRVPYALDEESRNFATITPLVVTGGFALATVSGTGPARNARYIKVDTQGAVLTDVLSEPIVSGDRQGDYFLLARPWGVVALAVDDPRNIVSAAIPILMLGQAPPWFLSSTVTSGDVTLVTFGSPYALQGILVSSTGAAIREKLAVPGSAVTASPEWFTFAWRSGSDIFTRRLSRSGTWLEKAPVLIASDPEALGVGVHGNGRDVLISWSTYRELAWIRLTHALQPIGAVRRAARRSTDGGTPSEVRVIGDEEHRLILTQETFVCRILCVGPELHQDVVSIDARGDATGAPQSYSFRGPLLRGVALGDGSWVLPLLDQSPDNVLHLAADGSLLERLSVPALAGYILDMRRAGAGWEALVDRPTRLVELHDVATPTAMTTLSSTALPHFGAGTLLLFNEPSALYAAASPALWSGRLVTRDGDVAVEVRDLSSTIVRRDEVEVRNESKFAATNVIVQVADPGGTLSLSGTAVGLIPSLAPGESSRFMADLTRAYPGQPILLIVGSDDIRDIDVADNIVTVPVAEPGAVPRKRSVRR